MKFIRNDGGRSLHFKGSAGDCVTRAIAIAAELPYDQVYAAMAHGNAAQRKTKRTTKSSGKRTARNGIYTKRKWFKEYMQSIGFVWTPTMHIGSGCTVHLCDGELPMGRLVVAVSKHYTAVIDGVINDTHDPQRNDRWYEPDCGQVLQANQRRLGPFDPTKQNVFGGKHGIVTTRQRCVYGYWQLTGE